MYCLGHGSDFKDAPLNTYIFVVRYTLCDKTFFVSVNSSKC